jgi:hypothetical protein
LVLFVFLVAGITTSTAQTPQDPTSVPSNPLPDWVRINAEKVREMERITERDPNRNVTIVLPRNTRIPPRPPRTDPPTSEEMAAAAEKAERLAVPRDYRHKYQDFLNGRYTGIKRIFPDKNCGMGEIVTLAEIERCADVPDGRGGGSMFSFRCIPDLPPADQADRFQDMFAQRGWDPCETKFTTDLSFRRGSFVAGDGGIVQGIMANIGDADLSAIDIKHKAVEFLDDYDPKQSIAGIAEQNKALEVGIKGKGYTFSNSLPVNVNSTYVLRSVLYRYHEKGAAVEPSRGVDIRVAFKVVGIEPDGSVVILWKELDRKYPRRQLKD